MMSGGPAATPGLSLWAYSAGCSSAWPGVRAFVDHAALKFNENAAHLEHGFAGGCPGVHALPMQVQIDAEGMQLTPRKPIRSCRLRPRRSIDHDMTMSNWRRAASLHMRSNAHPLVSPFGARNPVIPIDCHLDAHAPGDRPQLALLVGRRLILRRDPQMQGRNSRGWRTSYVPLSRHQKPRNFNRYNERKSG
jgi:hypothetical protein